MSLRLALAAAVIGYALFMRQYLGPCSGLATDALLVLPVLAVQGAAALASLMLAAVALVRRRRRSVLVELGMALLMLATFPVAMAANVVMNNDDCPYDDAR